MIQTWSCASTETPIVEPSTQWFGSGFGQNGSTSNRGAWTSSLRGRLVLQHGLADAERDDECGQSRADKKVTFPRCAFHGFPRFESELRCATNLLMTSFP